MISLGGANLIEISLYKNFSLIILFIFLILIFKLVLNNKYLKKEIKEKNYNIEKLKKDISDKLKKAQDVHQKMLPKKITEPEDFLFSDYYQPAEFIGGDYYNVFPIDHGAMNAFFDQYLIYFFDVSGHGIDSTLLSIFINDSIENYFKLKHNPGEMVSTKELMNYIDIQYQNEEFPDDYLVCLFIGVLDRNDYSFTYSSGGFQYPFFKIDSNKEIKKVDIGGLPISTALGSLKDSRTEEKIKVEKNSTIFLSTDGLLEQNNGQKTYYEKIDGILKKYKFLPAPFLKDLIRKDFYNFTDGNSGKDDITFLILDRPAGEIKEWNLNDEKNNNEQIFAELLNIIKNQNQKNSKAFLKLEDIIIAKKELLLRQKYKIKLLNNQSVLTISFENEGKDIISFKNLASVKNEDFFQKDKIYLSKNEFNNKVHLLVRKK